MPSYVKRGRACQHVIAVEVGARYNAKYANCPQRDRRKVRSNHLKERHAKGKSPRNEVDAQRGQIV